MKLLNIKFHRVKRRRLVFEDIIKFNGSKLEIVNNIQSRACLDCLVKRLINNFDCKINNYYGSLLLHENNHEYTKNIIEKGYEKMNKKILLRDMKYTKVKRKNGIKLQNWLITICLIMKEPSLISQTHEKKNLNFLKFF